MKLGSSDVSKLMIGSNEGTRAYLGSSLVYDSIPTPAIINFDASDVDQSAPNDTTSANVKGVDDFFKNVVNGGNTYYRNSITGLGGPPNFHRLTSDAQVFKDGGAFVFALKFSINYLTPDQTIYSNMEGGSNGILVQARDQGASAANFTGVDVTIKNSGTTCTISTPDNFRATSGYFSLIVVVPSSGTPYCHFGNTKYNGNQSLSGMGATTNAFYFANALVTPSPFSGIDGHFEDLCILSGDITNNEASLNAWDGTPEYFTGSPTILVDAPNGWPLGQQDFINSSDTALTPSISTSPESTNNFIPYFITPTANLDASKLVLKDSGDDTIPNTEYSVRYSDDGGTTLSSTYTGVAFSALGILTETIDVIYIQPTDYTVIKSGVIET